MSEIRIEKLLYKNFGECLKLSNDAAEAVVTLDFGPRVIRFAPRGGENFLYEDVDRTQVIGGEIMDAVYGKGSKWFSYGGHRMWMSPEDMPLSYYPDNERVAWEAVPGGVELIAPPQKINDIRYKLELTLSKEKPSLTVKHYCTNLGPSTKRQAVWALTVLGNGGLEVVPQPIHDTGLLANRVLSLWPYSDMSDDRVYWGKKYVTLRQDPTVESAFKFGINNIRGWAAYFNNGGMFIKKFTPNQNGAYPDFGTSFETYTNGHILEMETLGELTDITPGSTVFHAEEWSLVDHVDRPEPNDEVTIDALAQLYVEH